MPTHSSVCLCWVPVPVVPQAVDDVLNVQKPDGVSGITVALRWPLMSVDQLTTLHVFGQSADGSPRTLLVADAEPVTEAEIEQEWFRPVAWEQLQGLKDGSDLMFVFRVVQDEGSCACPVLFPPLSLLVQNQKYEYEDKTTFKVDDGTDDWNGWKRGAAGSDLDDLVIKPDEDFHVLQNNTFTNNSAGVVLSKKFIDLEMGQVYEFGMTVRRWNLVDPFPKLALETNTQSVLIGTNLTSTDWIELKGRFTADTSTMELSIVSEVSTGNGNDYAFRDIWVKSI